MKYNIILFCIVAAAALSANRQCLPAMAGEAGVAIHDTAAKASELLTLADATKIMGEPCSLTTNTVFKKGDTMEYKCGYSARLQDDATGKTGNLYFMYEVYKDIAAAANAYATIYSANAGHQGVKKVDGLGTEAYYHTDHTGFYFFLVRKNAKMFRLKLNKITSHASEAAFKTVVRNIMGRL